MSPARGSKQRLKVLYAVPNLCPPATRNYVYKDRTAQRPEATYRSVMVVHTTFGDWRV